MSKSNKMLPKTQVVNKAISEFAGKKKNSPMISKVKDCSNARKH